MELRTSLLKALFRPLRNAGLLILFLMGMGMVGTWGQVLPEGCLPKPQSRILVVDRAQLLAPGEEASLNQDLLAYMDSTSNVIYVVTHPDFCGMEPSIFATAAGHTLGVGRSDKDNGMVIAIKPRNGSEDGRVFIAVGYGLEGAIPDAVALRVVDRMLPDFAQGNWSSGLSKGTADLRKLASGEFTEENYMGSDPSGRKNSPGPEVFAFLLFILIMSIFFFAAVLSYRRTNNTGFWLSVIMILAEVMRSESGTYRGFSGGRGWGGGGGRGGGGFGGFGGGGFGGGGAGGRF